jgi:hypothetical protein
MNIELLREAFGSTEFSTREASTVLGTSLDATRTLLNELRSKGHLIRAGRGRYRAAEPGLVLTVARRRTELRLSNAVHEGFELGLDGPDAIVVWTRGRYTVHTDPNAIHIAVSRADEKAYRAYLAEVGLAVGEGLRRPHVMLRVVPGPCFTMLDGVPVLDREAVLRLIKDNPIAYEGAEEWLAFPGSVPREQGHHSGRSGS